MKKTMITENASSDGLAPVIACAFAFTSENLIANIDKLGPWSAYGMASSALAHYFTEKYDEEKGINPSVSEEVDLMQSLGIDNWHDLIIKYHNEVGYDDGGEGFNPLFINEG